MQWVGVFLTSRAATEGPVALFQDADQAQTWRRAQYGNGALVFDVAGFTAKAHDEESVQAAMDALRATPAETTAVIDPDAELRAQIRTEVEQEERRKRVRAEVQAERQHALTGDDDDDEKPPVRGGGAGAAASGAHAATMPARR